MLKRILSVLISFSMIFVLIGPGVFAESKDGSNNEYNFQLVEKNDTTVTVKAERDGDELYATLDKTTNEISMKAIERPKNLLSRLNVFDSVYTTTDYTVDIQTQEGPILDAVITDSTTGQEFKIEEGTDKVSAQLPILIVIAEWGGSALLGYLAANAAYIVATGIIAYEVSEMIDSIRKQTKATYWKAWVANGGVYLAPDAFAYDAAAFAYLNTSNSSSINLFAKTFDKAQQASKKVTGFSKWVQAEKYEDGYYPHFHPTEPTGEQLSNHIWYYPGT